MGDEMNLPVLYKLRDPCWGQKAIEERRLKVARLFGLNDPFDLLAPQLGPEGNALLRQAKREWNDKFAIICMSKNWQNPVVWSHYAASHRGIAMGFKTNKSVFQPIRYVRDRLHLEGWPRPFSCADVDDIISTKFCDWSYETEYRGTFTLDPCAAGNSEPCFEPFSPGMELVEVIIGCDSKITPDELRAKLGDLEHVKVFKARAHESEFKLEKDEV